MTIKNFELARQLQKAGIGFLELERGNGYFYVRSDNTYASNVLMGLPSTSIPVCFFKQQTIEAWVNDIREIWEEALESSGIATKLPNCERVSKDFPMINPLLNDPQVDDNLANQVEDLALQVYEGFSWIISSSLKRSLKNKDTRALLKEIHKGLKACTDVGVSPENVKILMDSFVTIAVDVFKGEIYNFIEGVDQYEL